MHFWLFHFVFYFQRLLLPLLFLITLLHDLPEPLLKLRRPMLQRYYPNALSHLLYPLTLALLPQPLLLLPPPDIKRELQHLLTAYELLIELGSVLQDLLVLGDFDQLAQFFQGAVLEGVLGKVREHLAFGDDVGQGGEKSFGTVVVTEEVHGFLEVGFGRGLGEGGVGTLEDVGAFKVLAEFGGELTGAEFGALLLVHVLGEDGLGGAEGGLVGGVEEGDVHAFLHRYQAIRLHKGPQHGRHPANINRFLMTSTQLTAEFRGS